MDVFGLARRRPLLWHATAFGGAETICEFGLWSTSALLDRTGVSGDRRSILESRRRDAAESIGDGTSQAVLRDQRPLFRRGGLSPYLHGVDEPGWFTLLNARVFFFARKSDCMGFVEAYAASGQDVLELDTALLLAVPSIQIEVTVVNSGALPRSRGPCRGPSTFLPLSELPEADAGRIREVTVLEGLADVPRAVRSVTRFDPMP